MSPIRGRNAPPRHALAVAVAQRDDVMDDETHPPDFDAFYDATATGLWRYLCRVAGDPTIADDVAQESYIRFLDRPPTRTAACARRAYLYQIASNLLRDRWRRGQRHQQSLDALRAAQPRHVQPSDGGCRHDVRAALARLPRQQRALLWLALVDGYTHREIATILSLRTASVKVLLFRAKRKLAALLDPAPVKP